MKEVAMAIPVVLVLSVATWVGFYYAFPDAPLTIVETAFVVFLIAALTLAVRGLMIRLRRRPE